MGYAYKGILFFICGMVFNDACGFIYKVRTPTMKHNEEHESYYMNFFIDKNEYVLTVPVSEVTFHDKILALTPYNKTNFIKKILGPSGNMFGMKLTPKNIGLKNLIIWKNKVQYKFKENDLIDLSPNSHAISYDTCESDIEDQTESTFETTPTPKIPVLSRETLDDEGQDVVDKDTCPASDDSYDSSDYDE